jgi:hypothetical protein
MSHFYGTLQGSRGQATRCGDKRGGLLTVAASWKGAVNVYVYHDHETGRDMFRVSQQPWHGAGVSQVLVQGAIGVPFSDV